jgi:hypothetical protein
MTPLSKTHHTNARNPLNDAVMPKSISPVSVSPVLDMEFYNSVNLIQGCSKPIRRGAQSCGFRKLADEETLHSSCTCA